MLTLSMKQANGGHWHTHNSPDKIADNLSLRFFRLFYFVRVVLLYGIDANKTYSNN